MKRALCLGVLALLITPSFGQDLASSFKLVRKIVPPQLLAKGFGNQTTPPKQPIPTGPEGPGGIRKEVTGPPKPMPPPQIGKDPENFNLRYAGRIRQMGDVVNIDHGVRFYYKNYDIQAEAVVGDLKTNVFTLTGDVMIFGAKDYIRGERVVLNFNSNTYVLSEGLAQVPPEKINGKLKSDLYVHGETIGGNDNQIDGRNIGFTTCDLVHPHFQIEAKKMDVRPNKRALMRDIKLVVLDKEILRLPLLIVPLNQFSDRYLPEFGQSRDEGYFVKTRFSTPLRGDDFVDSHVDYFTKLGAGLGVDYFYFNRSMQGVAKVYTLTQGAKSLSTSISHRQNLFGGSLSLEGDLQRNNYLTAPGTTTGNLRGNYQFLQGSNNTSIDYFNNGSRSSSFKFKQENLSVTDTRTLFKSIQTALSVAYSNNETSNPGASPLNRRVLDLQFRANHRMPSIDTVFEYVRSIPINDIPNFFGSSDRTPMLTMRSDSGRAFGKRFGEIIPFGLALSGGEISDYQTKKLFTRYTFDFDLSRGGAPLSWKMAENVYLSYSGAYRQGIYNDNTAQYLLISNANLNYSIGNDRSINLNWSYFRPYGYTPLTVDRTGQSNLVSASVAVKPLRSLQLNANFSYDIRQLQLRQTAWQTLNFLANWRPHDRFVFRYTAAYDTFRQVWSQQRFETGWYISDGLVSGILNYDGTRHSWGNISLYAEGLKWGKFSLATLMSYNGYTRRFEARHYSLIYDLHCAEAIFQVMENPSGFRAGTEFAFFIRIKGLPFDTPFGIGKRGQAVGSGGGIRP